MTSEQPPELIVALDVSTKEQAVALVRDLTPTVHWFKIGKQLFTRYGPAAVEPVLEQGAKVFLDLKYMDIPNTVYGAIRSAWELGVRMTTVHTSGGPAMLAAAAHAAQDTDVMVMGVTVLTSMDEAELRAIGIAGSVEQQVQRLALLASNAGLAGVVCSAHEVGCVQEVCRKDFSLVVPGIRPQGSSHADQKRVMTPREAMTAGADYIVVGRPVTEAVDPKRAAENIIAEMSTAEGA